MKTYRVIIEKGKDGVFHAYNDDTDAGVFCGHGGTPQEAKADFLASLKEVAEMKREEGKPLPEFCSMEPEYVYDVASFLSAYDVINVSALARRMGINESLMRQYKAGKAYLSAAQMSRIADGIHQLGSELASLRIV